MFVLKKRKYTWLDMYRIPFSCAPVSTVLVTVQKAVTALANIFQVIVVAEFLDGTIDAVIHKNYDRKLIVWFVLMLLMVSWKRVSYNIGRLFTSHFVTMGNRQVLQEFTKKRNRLEYYLLEDPDTEELTNRVVNKLERNLEELLQRFVNFFVVYIPRITGVLLIIASHVWWLAIVVMVMAVPLVLISLRGGQKIYRANEEAAVYERRHKYLFDVLTGREATEERSLFGYGGAVNAQWHRQYDTARKINMKAEALFTLNMQGGSIITSILASVVSLIMIPLTASGALSVGLFISLSTAIYDLVNLMGWEMTRAVAQIARYREYMKDLTAFAALPERQASAEEAGALERQASAEEVGVLERREAAKEAGASERREASNGAEAQKSEQASAGTAAGRRGMQQEIPRLQTLEFRHVTFRYPGTEVDILKDFSMELRDGVHYAIVGENGAGKSTLIKLLTGLYRDYEGEILYNGIEMRNFPQEQWFCIFSCVFQDFARYYLSVKENICLGAGNMEFETGEGTCECGTGEGSEENSGKGDSSHKSFKNDMESRMKEVTRQLGLQDAISSLKYGYETRLGKLDEDSVDLSGGQWQRVAMARALMNDAPVLLLDEPTAALDPISESALYEKFGEISKGHTTIFISHRLGSTKLSDHIFVLKDGCVREQGSHEELMTAGGIYAAMYETQQSWYVKEEGGEA